ncbi:karyopherin beta, partial [Kappamyces sp. JEL0680]
MNCLSSGEAIVGTVAGQLIAAIADIELPHDAWNDLIPSLLERVTQAPTALSKKSTLQCIGFICEAVDERNYVMQIVCEATQCLNSPEVQVISFECLVKIVGLYYDQMQLYMQKALFGLTVLGMRHDNEQVALQAIEFWSTICEIEYDRNLSIQDGDDSLPCLHFAQAAMPEIVPVIL